MKQSSEALSKAQDQALERRELLEAGRVRISTPPQKPQQPQQDKAGSKNDR